LTPNVTIAPAAAAGSAARTAAANSSVSVRRNSWDRSCYLAQEVLARIIAALPNPKPATRMTKFRERKKPPVAVESFANPDAFNRRGHKRTEPFRVPISQKNLTVASTSFGATLRHQSQPCACVGWEVTRTTTCLPASGRRDRHPSRERTLLIRNTGDSVSVFSRRDDEE
jgi:hypothetical protein